MKNLEVCKCRWNLHYRKATSHWMLISSVQHSLMNYLIHQKLCQVPGIHSWSIPGQYWTGIAQTRGPMRLLKKNWDEKYQLLLSGSNVWSELQEGAELGLIQTSGNHIIPWAIRTASGCAEDLWGSESSSKYLDDCPDGDLSRKIQYLLALTKAL